MNSTVSIMPSAPLAMTELPPNRMFSLTRLPALRIRGDDPAELREGVGGGPGEPLDDAVELTTAVEPVGEAGEV